MQLPTLWWKWAGVRPHHCVLPHGT